MDKQIIKNIIIEKQIAIPNYKLVHRDFLFGDKSNYILVGIRRGDPPRHHACSEHGLR